MAKKGRNIVKNREIIFIGLLAAIIILTFWTFTQVLQQQRITTESEAASIVGSCNINCERQRLCRKGLRCVRVNGDEYRCRNPRTPSDTRCRGCRWLPDDPVECFPTLPVQKK